MITNINIIETFWWKDAFTRLHIKMESEDSTTHLLHNVWRENSRGESPAEDIGELPV